MRCSTGLLDEVFVLHPKQEGQAMAMLAPQVPVPIMPLLEALPRPPPKSRRHGTHQSPPGASSKANGVRPNHFTSPE